LERKHLTNQSDGGSELMSGIRILFLISFVFLVTNLTGFLSSYMYGFELVNEEKQIYFMTTSIASIVFNSSSNFVFYVFCGRHFRECMGELCKCGRLVRGRGISQKSTSTVNTIMSEQY
jgi:hypothetical protein